jgi:NitT/TauT family transport system substrate-binding protein
MLISSDIARAPRTLTLGCLGVSVWVKIGAERYKNTRENVRMLRWLVGALFSAAIAASIAPATAQPELRISRTTTMAYLPLMVAEHEKLFEKHATEIGIPNLKVSIHTFTGPSAQFDALFSGNVDVVAVGSTALITLWARTKGTANEVKGVSALSSMPIALSTRNPQVKSIRDFTDKDRIAVPSVNVSFQAMLLQMAAAKEWGNDNYKKLDHLTVGLGQMDAVAAMAQPNHEVSSDFATPPFLYIEREMQGVRSILTMKEILGENGTIGTAATTTHFRESKPELYKVLVAGITEAMEIIAKDKPRAVEGYIGATGDRKTTREMLLKIANDPDVEFTMTPRAMKHYADFMLKTGGIKRAPERWSELFFGETAALNGS